MTKERNLRLKSPSTTVSLEIEKIGSSANVWRARRRSSIMKLVYSSFPQIRRILSFR